MSTYTRKPAAQLLCGRPGAPSPFSYGIRLETAPGAPFLPGPTSDMWGPIEMWGPLETETSSRVHPESDVDADLWICAPDIRHHNDRACFQIVMVDARRLRHNAFSDWLLKLKQWLDRNKCCAGHKEFHEADILHCTECKDVDQDAGFDGPCHSPYYGFFVQLYVPEVAPGRNGNAIRGKKLLVDEVKLPGEVISYYPPHVW